MITTSVSLVVRTCTYQLVYTRRLDPFYISLSLARSDYSDRLRGTGGDLIILEEGAYIDNDLFYKVVLPLLEVDATALIGISTPRDDDDGSYYSDIVRRCMPDGKLIFNVERIQGACEQCLRDLPDPTKCPHVRMVTPAHKSADKQRIVMQLYGDQKDVMARESLGIATSGVSGKFNKMSVDAFLHAAPVPAVTCRGPVYVAINPNGGVSGYTVVSGCYVGDKLVVIGMDMTQVTNFDEMARFVQSHITELRNLMRHCNDRVPIVLLPESSLGHEAAQIRAATQHLPGVVCCRETKEGRRWGVPLHDSPALADHLERVLDPKCAPPDFVKDTCIALSSPLVSTSAEKCVTEMDKQLKAWRPVYRTSGDTRKLMYSGRVDGDGKIRKHMRDDLCTALQLLSYWSMMIRQQRMANFDYTFI